MTIAVLGIAAGSLTAPRAQTQYVNSALCEQCHAEIAASFRKTGMGRSFYRLQPANAIEDFTPGKPF